MQKRKIYPKEWLTLHPYVQPQASDRYFVDLANRLYTLCSENRLTPGSLTLSESLLQRLCLYAAAYLEDVISGLGLWQAFIRQHRKLYGTPLPFYHPGSEYLDDEINLEDVCFLIWNTLQKSPEKNRILSNLKPTDLPNRYASENETEERFIHPFAPFITELAQPLYEVLNEVYETAPANTALTDYFLHVTHEKEARTKLHWLFGHTYLTAPSVEEYLPELAEADYYRIPCGPLALFLHEWIEELTEGKTESWKSFPALYPPTETLTETQLAKNRMTYERFVKGNQGYPIVYLEGYEALHHFLTHVLLWPNDPNHTLPQMKPYHDFVLMVHPDKGILLAKDICACISDPLNPLYQPERARQEAFRLLTVPTTCPPDLLTYVLDHHYLPDAQWPTETACQQPDSNPRTEVQQQADFLARHTLLYYYRGD